MTCLHITIEQIKGRRFSIKSDNMRREDAKADEITFANKLEEGIHGILRAFADQILRDEMTQAEPLK